MLSAGQDWEQEKKDCLFLLSAGVTRLQKLINLDPASFEFFETSEKKTNQKLFVDFSRIFFVNRDIVWEYENGILLYYLRVSIVSISVIQQNNSGHGHMP